MQKGIFGFSLLLLLLVGVNIFFNIPSNISAIKSDSDKYISTISSVSSENRIEGNCQTSSEDRLNTSMYQDEDKSESIQGMQEIREGLEQIALHNERIGKIGLDLKYHDLDKKDEIRRVSGCLNAGETLYQHLVEHDISPGEVLRLQEKVNSVVDIGYLNAGTKFTVHYDNEGKIVQFDYQPNQLDVYHIKISKNDLGNIKVSKDEIFKEIVCLEGEIKTSLYESMIEHSNSGQLAVEIAEIFAWDIDFLTECQAGDTFKILVEKLYRGDFYRWGDVLAAVYEGEMLSTHTAILFEDPGGSNNYYDSKGRCLKKAFLRAPLDYKYISSQYTESRFHPILRIHRPHRAIDYAAPTGTPVVTIGAGTVISRYYDQGGYGNYVQVRHPNGYVTGYGHLSKFAQGLQVGQRVKQGEIIGYVGATGLATGPHLDFSISKDGRRFNFLDLEMPPASSISPDYQSEFDMVKENYLSILQESI